MMGIEYGKPGKQDECASLEYLDLPASHYPVAQYEYRRDNGARRQAWRHADETLDDYKGYEGRKG